MVVAAARLRESSGAKRPLGEREMDADKGGDIARLEARRAIEHRLTGKPMRDARQVNAFLRDRRVVMWTGKAAMPSLSNAIAGRELKGSWMANPEVHLIYRLAGKLDDGVLGAPLILGKRTLLDPSLAPALYGLAADPDAIARRRSKLTPAAAELLGLVHAAGEVRMDELPGETKQLRKARVELEAAFLLYTYDIHTDSGAHTSIALPWSDSPAAASCRQDQPQSFDTAAVDLVAACLRSAVLATEREIRKWFDGAGPALDTLIASGGAVRLGEGKSAYVTLGQLVG